MRRAGLLGLVCLAALSGCSLLFPEDPREGEEPAAECVSRITAETARQMRELADHKGLLTPTYTYDVTKMDLEAMQALIVSGSDETAGVRTRKRTNEVSTAVDQFMNQSVDEKGAFYLGRDPALYRVRGEPVAVDEVITKGCERQQAGMRLISLTTSSMPMRTDAEPDAGDANETPEGP
ncbi:MAG: hypothetical protein AAF494_02230 [Pseudomonadota bacterium]